MIDHTYACLFCAHEFTGRRRKFCFDCLPDFAGCEDYTARYNRLYRACGLHPETAPVCSKLPPWPKPPKPDAPCAGCGVLVATKWCSATCSARYRRRFVRLARGSVNPPDRLANTAPVTTRQVDVIPSVNNRRIVMLEKLARLPPIGDCRRCGGELKAWWLIRKGEKPKRICYACSLEVQRERDTRRRGPVSRSTRTVTVIYRCCAVCSAQFVANGHGSTKACSPACSQVLLRDRNRRKNQRRRALVVGESYSLAELIDRDRSTCHLCGKRVDCSLSGSDELGPTIDHILPLSLGGADCKSNVKLAHRSCNVSRGNRGTVQLMLVG